MKALKEKRIGVRSLLRRGLIILSLFALVFAVACGGDDGNSSSPGTDVPPPPAAKTVKSIVIINQPSELSFQGLPPNLTGLTAQVTWSDDTREIADATKFVGVPPNVDDAELGFGTSATGNTGVVAVREYSVAYIGHTEELGRVVLPGVVPLLQSADALQLTGKTTQTIYSDEIPTFPGLTLEGIYEDYWQGDKLYTKQKKVIPVTATYPPIIDRDAFNSTTQPYLTFGIGYNPSNNNTPPSVTDPASYNATAIFNIEKVVEAVNVTVADSSVFADYFDDDLFLAADTDANKAKALASLRDNSDIKLTVFYFDGTSKEKTFKEYLETIDYFNARQTTKVSPVERGNGYGAVATDRASKNEILNISEDSLTGSRFYNLTMNYIPKIWGTSGHSLDDTNGTAAWLDQFSVRIPVYEFLGDAVVTRKANTGSGNVMTVAANSSPDIATTANWETAAPGTNQGDNLMQGIVALWELTGTYEREGVQKTKAIALTPQMFADGLSADPRVTATIGAPTTKTFTLDGKAAGYDWSDTTNGLSAGETGFNYILKLWYRDVLMDAEDTAVVVDLIGPTT